MEELEAYLEESKTRKERLKRDESNRAHIKNCLDYVYNYIGQLNDGSYDTTKLNTGIAAVDRVTGGLEFGDLVAINGDRGTGRTALALHYAIEAAEKIQKPVVIYSQSHSSHQITIRLLSMLTGIPIALIEAGKLNEEQWIQLSIASNWLSGHDIYIYDMGMRVQQLLDYLEDEYGLGLLIIDGAPLAELDPETLQNMSMFADMNKCCVLFNCYYPSVAPYIEGYVSKVLCMETLEEDTYHFELRWTWHGHRQQSRLYWNKSCLRFMDEPHCNDNSDDCV